eukprot:8507832-Ditylum_brightwellii.AAC.1
MLGFRDGKGHIQDNRGKWQGCWFGLFYKQCPFNYSLKNFLLSNNILIASAQQITMLQIRLNMTKPMMIKGVVLIGTDTHTYIQGLQGSCS